MVRFILTFLFLVVSFSIFAAQQYTSGVYWNQGSESNNLWNFKLISSANSKYDAFGVYKLSEGVKNSSFKLNEGDNILTVTENLGFWVSSGNKIYSSEDWFKNPFYYQNEYTVGISEKWFWNDSYISIREASSSPTGQPLPGVLATLVVGGIASSIFLKRKRNHSDKSM